MFLGMTLLLVACSPEQKGEMPNNDYESSTFKRAKEKYELRDYRGAINLYEEVLRENASMAKAHFELGLIYNDKVNDPISAIYHFRKFLRLRPNSEREKTIQEWISRAELAIASSQPNSPMESTEQFVELQKENLVLKNANEKLQQELVWLKHQLADKPEKNKVPPVIEPVKTTQKAVNLLPETQSINVVTNSIALKLVTNTEMVSMTTNIVTTSLSPTKKHTVQAGETLWRIAVRYYPEQVKEGAKKIMEANLITDPSKIRSGQTLTIP